MLSRIEIDGFKTFENFSVDLAPFVAILGTNASGKSNLFDAIQLLSNLATQDVSESIKGMRGEPIELFRRTNKDLAKRMRFAVEMLVDPEVLDPWGSRVTLGHTRLRYEVELETREAPSGISRILVSRESATPIFSRDDGWARSLRPTLEFRQAHLKYSRKAPLLTTEGETSTGLTFNVHQDGKQGRVRPASAAQASVLYSITNTEFPHLFAIREEMRNWRLLQLDPALLRRPAPATAPELLAADGSNLAAVLARIKAETRSETRPFGALIDIAAELNTLIPDITSLNAELDSTRSEYRVDLTMRDGPLFSSRVVSDGTLRILALLTLLHDPRHRGLVCFEEPENGVHPARLKQLVSSLRDMVTRPSQFPSGDVGPLSQLLMNSHSPVVLSALVNEKLQSFDDPVMFADTANVVDPIKQESRRRTRLRSVQRQTQGVFEAVQTGDSPVSHFEVEKLLETATVVG